MVCVRLAKGSGLTAKHQTPELTAQQHFTATASSVGTSVLPPSATLPLLGVNKMRPAATMPHLPGTLQQQLVKNRHNFIQLSEYVFTHIYALMLSLCCTYICVSVL